MMKNQQPPGRDMADAAAFAENFQKYRFYHRIEVAEGVVTPGVVELVQLQKPVLAEIRARDLTGLRVLDIGCCDGLFSFAAERQGAAFVLGIDNALSLAAVEFLIPHFCSRVEMREVNICNFAVPPAERFDFIIFAGVLYHLRDPYLALKRIADLLRPDGELLIETALLLSHHRHPLMYVPAPKDSPYEPTSVTFFNHRALVAALECMGFDRIECRAVISPSPGWPIYAGWEAFLQGQDRHLASTDDMAVGRAT
jgi:SAM-dependent methyltransferase